MSPSSVSDVAAAVQRLWPQQYAAAWDAVGIVSGRDDAPVTRVLLAVDAVAATADEAIAANADVLVVHHPLLLRGVTSVAERTAKGALLASLIRADCALIAAHTNADIVARGTSDALAQALGLTASTPIEAVGHDEAQGFGRVGELPQPLTARHLAERVANVLPATATGVRLAGDPERLVLRVAVCGGAGDSLLDHPEVVAADAYITSDLRHHPASDARERALLGRGPVVIDTSHWASESLWLPHAAHQLALELPGVDVVVSSKRTDPWDLRVATPNPAL